MQIKQKIRDMGFKHKIIMLNTIIIMIMFLGTVLGITLIINNYNEIIYKTTLDNLKLSTAGIYQKIQEVEKLSEYIVTDDTVQKELDKISKGQTLLEYKQTVSDLTERINKYIGSEYSIVNVSLIDVNGNQISSSTQKVIPENIIEEAQELGEIHNGGAAWYVPDTDDGNIICVREILKIQNLELTSLGSVMIRVNLETIVEDNLKSLLHGGSLDAGKFYVFHNEKVIYPLNHEDIETEELKYIKDEGYNMYVIGGTKYLMTYNNIQDVPLTYALLIPYDKVYQAVDNSNKIIITIGILLLICSIGVSIILVDKLMIHFEHLVQYMKKFKGDNLIDSTEHEKYQNRKDEIGFLHTTFYDMAKDIDYLVNESLKKQILLKDTQLNHLVSQINPHFLYNTLNSINWIAKMNKQKHISQMIEALGMLMRSAISEKSDLITLGRELEIVRSYIFIQKVRYEERLDFEIEVEESLYNHLIPKLCIQPLVENCINHVLEHKEEVCKIRVKAYIKENQLYIIVSDNGEGIDEDILYKLQVGEIKPKNTGIGLGNIQKRIDLLYGKSYGLIFKKIDGVGQVWIHIPLVNTKGESEC